MFKRWLSLIISTVLLCRLLVGVSAVGEPNALSYLSKASVSGSLDSSYADKDVTLMLVKKNVAPSSITKEDIGYFGITKADVDGNYNFNFTFQGNTDDYEVKVNQAGTVVTSSVKKAVAVNELVSVTLKVVARYTYVEAIADIKNIFDLDSITYVMGVAFYSDIGKLLNVSMIKGELTDEIANEVIDKVIPENTAYIKAFVWDSTEKMVSLCPSEVLENGTIQSFTILYPGFTNKALTLSYDDGRIDKDSVLVNILNNNGIKATFNVTDAYSSMIPIYAGHEVANHTYTHPHMYKTDTSDPDYRTYDQCIYYIDEGSRRINNVFGEGTGRGFVWPYRAPTERSDYNEILAYVKNNYAYARPVTSSGNFDLPTDWYNWKPTCHHKDLNNYVQNFLTDSNDNKLKLFYIWGHAAEFDTDNNWSLIEDFAALMKNRDDVWKATNIQIHDYIEATKVLDVGEKMVYNPSNIDVYAKINGSSIIIPAGCSVGGSVR